MDGIIIREIQANDDKAVAALIRQVLIEFDVPKVGSAYADPQLDCMTETYSAPKSAYFIAEINSEIVGCAGIALLENSTENICELQKMYFLERARGKGIGARMMQYCLEAAKAFGYEKCYLETMPNMSAAQKLYKKSGFENVCSPMGNTGHNACPVWMLKDLR
ncbi:GNAT family N-acetyltransferase [Flavobacterium sp. 3HN19-14]|uniref:GNAT family N-acetyltransferase n=1 Tax=Flavobacterium sp. 3HN19-14 TaxID=3448133 RepID=UPI003EE06EB9